MSGKAKKSTKKKAAATSADSPRMNIQDFNRIARLDQEREDCIICQLPENIRAELRAAVDKGIKLPMRVRYLKEICEVGHSIGDLTVALRKHLNSRHEEGD